MNSSMQIVKRNGSKEPVDLQKITKSISRHAEGLPNVDAMRVAVQTIGGLYDGASTAEIDALSIRIASSLIGEDPTYSYLAARLLAETIAKEVRNQNIHSSIDSLTYGVSVGLVNAQVLDWANQYMDVDGHDHVDASNDKLFEYFGLRTVYDRYLLRDPKSRKVIETPQQFFRRVAISLSGGDAQYARELYSAYSKLEYLSSTPTLFNAGTNHQQMSSCYLLNSPEDSLEGIYKLYTDVARLSKYAGGIGLPFTRVRSKGSLIRGTNGLSNGIVPWLKTLDSSVAAVNQCFEPETRVLTRRGWIEIKDIVKGDLVLGVSGAFREVKEVMAYPQTDAMYRLSVEFNGGTFSRRVTAGHPVYVADMLGGEWKEVKDLKVNIFAGDATTLGNSIIVPRIEEFESFSALEAVVAAQVDADPSMSKYGALISQVRDQRCLLDVMKLEKVEPVATVHDLIVEGDESYLTELGMAHNGGKRKGAAAVYLETWHADIEDFLELRDNTGDHERRTHNLNLTNWIPDEFMRRVESNGQWSLFDPAVTPKLYDTWGDEFDTLYRQYEAEGLAVRTMPARDLYSRMMRTLAETGQGWMTFKDATNRVSNQTLLPENVIHNQNLCVAPETDLLTDQGNFPIASLVDREVTIWNGEEWSDVTVRQTGTNQKLLTVNLSDGRSLDATPYHKWYVQDTYHSQPREVRTHELEVGQKLIKFKHPVIEGHRVMDRPYLNGFFTGDGTALNSRQSIIYLYDKKMALASEPEFSEIDFRETTSGSIHRYTGYAKGLESKYFVPSAEYDLDSRMRWLAGWLDADGTVAENMNCQTIQGSSNNFEFLKAVQSMLLESGVSSVISLSRPAGTSYLPMNDGSGKYKHYPTKSVWRLLISGTGVQQLIRNGIELKRLKIVQRDLQREAIRFAVVTSVVDNGRYDDTYCVTEPKRHMAVFNGILTGNCTEIAEVTSDEETAVCNLGSVNLARHVHIVDGEARFNFDKLIQTVKTAMRQLNTVPELNFYPTDEAKVSNLKWRPVGLGCMGLQDALFVLGLAFGSPEAIKLTANISEVMYYHALSASADFARVSGPHSNFAATRASKGVLHHDHFPNRIQYYSESKWNELRAKIAQHGLANSLVIAIAPTATIASIAGCYECIEPQVSNLFKRESLSGDFLQVNRYLVAELKKIGLWTSEVRDAIKLAEGSIQGIETIPQELRDRFKTAWEIQQRDVIAMAVARLPYIDQSQSLNLFQESPNIGRLSSMYMHAWKEGLKSTYYLRSRPATKIAKTTVSAVAVSAPAAAIKAEEAVAAVFCSLENPEACESCS